MGNYVAETLLRKENILNEGILLSYEICAVTYGYEIFYTSHNKNQRCIFYEQTPK
jgi:hypothetical protein